MTKTRAKQILKKLKSGELPTSLSQEELDLFIRVLEASLYASDEKNWSRLDDVVFYKGYFENAIAGEEDDRT